MISPVFTGSSFVFAESATYWAGAKVAKFRTSPVQSADYVEHKYILWKFLDLLLKIAGDTIISL